MTYSNDATSTVSGPAERLQRIAALTGHDLEQAIDLAQAALADGLAEPMLYNLVAHRLEQQGQVEESYRELAKGLDHWPDDVQLLVSAGFCLLKLDRRLDALALFDRAIRVEPGFAAAWFGRGSALRHLARLDEVGAAFRKAVSLMPDYADALAGLGELAERQGQVRDARAYAERALGYDPGHVEAHMTLARIELAEKAPEAAEAQARRLIDFSHIDPLDRATALIVLGDALDAQDRIEEAFANYSLGKAELHAAATVAFEGPGVESAVASTRRLAAETMAILAERDWPEAAADEITGPAREHVFLLGFMRSGTTLLENVLAGHPDIVTLEERPLFKETEARHLVAPGGLRGLVGLDPAGLAELRADYWNRVRAFGVEPTGKVFIDKLPMNTMKLPALARLFPRAKFLFALRDPRDVTLSCFRRPFRMNAVTYEFSSLERTAVLYDAVMEAADLYRRVLPLDLHLVRYERLVTDFQAEAEAACAFLGLPWNDELAAFADRARTHPIATPSATQVARGLYTDALQQWRRYETIMAPALPILEPWADRFGYPPA